MNKMEPEGETAPVKDLSKRYLRVCTRPASHLMWRMNIIDTLIIHGSEASS